MKRSLIRLLGRCLIAVFLTAQFAVAAYACPVMMQAGVSGVVHQADEIAADVTTVSPLMADCGDALGSGDAALPNLCAAHCEAGQQLSQAAFHVTPIDSWPVVLYDLTQLPPRLPPVGRPAAASISALVAAAPVHAILHCVRRT